MDEYWKKIGEEIKERKLQRIIRRETKRINKTQAKLNSKMELYENAKKNKKRWPKGVSNVFNLLLEFRIRFEREKVIGFPNNTFRQPDFAIPKLKLFIEIDGPEHQKWKDDFREKQILALPFYKDWRFWRMKSDVATDINQCYVALKPIIGEWLRS